MYCGFLPHESSLPASHAIPEDCSLPLGSLRDVRRHTVIINLDTRTREQLGETVLVKVWITQVVEFLPELHHQI